tara:strand:+ start:25053 stop:28184 length:3132 start_codon:yes stop_codon:yes gene_type:complete
MSAGTCIPGTNIVRKEQRDMLNQLESLPIMKKWSKDLLSTELGWNDKGTFDWLWKKYTGEYFDFNTVKITQQNINIFAKALEKEFLPKIQNRSGFFSTLFKLPKVLARNFKGGEDFVTEIGEAVGYNQKLLKDGASHIKEMQEGLYEMMFDTNHPIIKELHTGRWTKKQFNEFRNWENIFKNSSPNSPAWKEAKKRVIDFMGSGLPNDPIGGKILRRFQDILEFKVEPITAAEQKIAKNWDILRTDSMKDLLNGAIAAKRTIETLLKSDPNKPQLMKAYEKITEQIESLLVKSDFNKQEVSNKYILENGIIIPQNPKDFYVYDPVTKSKKPYMMKDGTQAIGIQGIVRNTELKYSPHYVIELSNIMHNLIQYTKSGADKSAWKNKTALEIQQEIQNNLSSEAISNRLKQAGETDSYHSLDPLYYLNKYVHDVASFNMRSRINLSYATATTHLVQAMRKNTHGRGNIKIGEHASYLIDMLTEIKDSALISNGSNTTNLDHMVRIINGFEYISKLGFSFKGGIKNRLQGVFNWTRFGRRGIKYADEFYNTTDRPYQGLEITNREMETRQRKRFGMMIGEKAEGAQISAATKGFVDFLFIPKGMDIDANGQLVRTTSGSALKTISRAISKGADISSKYTMIGKVGSQQWAENTNRIRTFEIQFAHSFMAESRRIEYHRAKYLEQYKREPKSAELWDYIERISGNQAFEMVKTLHFDYDNWAKAKILQRNPNKSVMSTIGQTVGQFQHFKFAFWDLQWNIMRDMTRDIKGMKMIVNDPIGKGNKLLNTPSDKRIINPNINQGMRLASLYSIIPGLIGLITDYDVGGVMSVFGITPFEEDRLLKDGTESKADRSSSFSLLENPLLEDASKLVEYISTWDHEGDEEAELRHYSAYYGKNPITGNLGPFVSDLLTAAELMDWLNLTGDHYEEHRKLIKDTSDPDWWYQMGRIFNIQAARGAWKSGPAFLKGQTDKAFRIETGMYKPKWITKWRQKTIQDQTEKIYGTTRNKGITQNINVLPEINFKKSKRRGKTDPDILKRKALSALRNM